MTKAAFFGLGNMGLPMACNLLRNGVAVISTVHHDTKGPEALQAAGGKIVGSRGEAVRGADILFVNVSNDQAIQELLLDPDVLENLPENLPIVELTSCSAEVELKVAAAYATKKARILSAPILGGPAAARDAQICLICAGDRALYDELQPFLQMISRASCYVGALGNAKKVKSLNNLYTASVRVMCGELAELVRKNGIDPEVFAEVIRLSPNNSVQFQNNFPLQYAQDYRTIFALDLMRKDVGLALDLAGDLPVTMSRLILTLYKNAAAYDKEDCNAVVKAETLAAQ